MLSIKFLSLLLTFLLTVVNTVQAASFKSYQYDSIAATIKINQDSTFDVEETQVFKFQGNYHKGFRSIPKNKIDTISDISVIDGTTNQKLTFSKDKLNKDDPDSWGKYTYYSQNRVQYIEWYYDLTDTSYSWILKYKVHGGLEFNKDFDRLYWNIFTDYDAPVKYAQVRVILPGNFDLQKIPVYSYRSIKKPIEQNISDSILFTSSDFVSKEAFTIDVSWPKGAVSRLAYWVDFVKIYWGYVFSVVIFLGSVSAGFIYWLISERLKNGRGTIISQYQPPENLRPAIAEIITKERLTNKGLTATIVDLAIRGFIKIEEDPKNKFRLAVGSMLQGMLSIGLALFMFYIIFGASTSRFPPRGFNDILVIILVGGFIGLLAFFYLREGWNFVKLNTDYKVTKLKSLDGAQEYEKKYLNILFEGKDYFKTKSLRHSRSQKLYNSIQKLKDDIYKHANVQTQAYEVDLIEEKKKVLIWGILFAAIILSFLIVKLGQIFILIAVSAVSMIGLYAFVKYEARLNKAGRILKENWLGFKMYLEKAEKYRLQNLTPDLFEKYLPYAMIFGIEKEWAKGFEGVNMPSPSWYGRGGHGGSGVSSSNSSGSSFSPSGFSASFTSFFNSSFGGAGGSGGGGGGAGGGGGGGGGGAS